MIEGDSGLIRACELAGEDYEWKPALKEFTFENGAKAFGFSAEEPESLRGPEHGAAWLDEPCHMEQIEEVWSNLNLGLRQPGLPGGAKVLLTSSPLPTQWTKDRIKEEHTVLVQVPTSVNLHNLDEGYRRRVIDPLKGTRKGKQELDAMLLEDVEGALWESDWLQRKAMRRADADRVVVAVDPSGTDSTSSDLSGIVVAGRFGDEYGVFEDATDRYTPNGWAKKAIALYEKWEADAIVLERYGGDSATTILRNAGFKGKIVQVKARVGKKTRAEPVSGLYEQRAVWHLEGAELADLEDQMLTWVPELTKKSPDRVDALVWAITELSKPQRGKGGAAVPRGNLPTTSVGRRPVSRPWKNRKAAA
jgi:phage terminase large subunit-like protein